MATVAANNKDPFIRYPELPPIPKGSTSEFTEWYPELQRWYADFRRLLQRDREDILAKINKLS